MNKKYQIYLGIFLLGLGLGYMALKITTPNEIVNQTSNKEHSWTCSMHPNINSEQPGNCPICGMDLTKSTLDYDETINKNSFRLTKNAIELANVETIVIDELGSENYSTALSGVITSNLKTNAIQTTLFDGRIDKLEINYIGKYVAKGQQIGVVYSPEMYAAQDKLLTSASYKESHEKLFNAARNTLGLWKMSDKQIEEVLKTGKPMMNFPIYADVSGTVTEIIAQEGRYFKQGDPLYKLSSLSTVWAVFDIYENQLSEIKVGQDIEISTTAFSGEKFNSTISFIDPVFDNNKRTVSIRAVLNNRDQKFKPGMFVNGNVKIIGKKENTIRIPKSAVLWTGKRSVVYIKTDQYQPVFEMREVTLGNTLRDSYEILDGLSRGEEVVSNGIFTIDAAAQLLGKKSMMSIVDDNTMQHSSKIIDNDMSHSIMDFPVVLPLYFAIKDNMVKGSSKDVKSNAKEFHDYLKLFNKSSKIKIDQDILQELYVILNNISNSDDISKQRIYFKALSTSILKIIPEENLIDKPVYVQFCPMADSNKGGYWLSLSKEIRNPYFGDKMLTCGSVKKTIN